MPARHRHHARDPRGVERDRRSAGLTKTRQAELPFGDPDDERPGAARPGLRLLIRADGAARGNPGPASAGAVLIDASRSDATAPGAAPLAVIARPLGIQTNNVAEYTAVVLALDAAERLGADEVDLVLDSLLIVEQLAGRWKVRDPRMRALRDQVMARLGRMRRWSVLHEPRARNSAADALANLALDDPRAAEAAERAYGSVDTVG